ncbi:MAG: 23S rRNA (adenine(2503)-C(2))-methyltransferase RlmN [bacterium]
MNRAFLLDELPAQWRLPDGAAYRRAQICQWVFAERAQSFEEMSNLPIEWRRHLTSLYELHVLDCERVQGTVNATRKYLWKLKQGDFIESVLIPASPALYGEKSDRRTLCVSTQVGCAHGCKFCASGLQGLQRNLSPAEMVAQIIETERQSGGKINNLVFMGMGEPLANFKNLMIALEIINAPLGLNIGARHITISTCGLAPQITQLAEQPRQVRLAVSLHAGSDAVRNQIMPINKKYPMKTLMDACLDYVSKKSQKITLEYILIEGVNDMLSEAALLAEHAHKLRAKVNLIPYNPVKDLPWKRPSEKTVRAFADALQKRRIAVTMRREKGNEIEAACGQLRLTAFETGKK